VFASDFQEQLAVQDRYDELMKLLKNGDHSLNQPGNFFLSKKWNDFFSGSQHGIRLNCGIGIPVFVDKLYSSWKIMHFHLDFNKKQTGRGDAMLFAIFKDNKAYFIGIRGKGLTKLTGHESLYDDDIIRMAYRNWPELFTQNRMNSISGEVLTTKQVRNLREQNTSYFLDVDGTTLRPFSIQVRNGLPFDVVQMTDYIVMKFERHP